MAGELDAPRHDTATPDVSGGLPAIVHSACRGETPLLGIDLRRDTAPRCPYCGVPFPGFGPPREATAASADPAGTVLALIEALEVRARPEAAALLHPTVLWRDEDEADRAVGPEAVSALWSRSPATRSVWQLTQREQSVHALVLERGATQADDRLVSWFVTVSEGLVRSCWVSVLGRGAALGGRRGS